MDALRLIQETRQKLSMPPRSFSFFDRRALKMRAPFWMTPLDRLYLVYRQQDHLLEQGQVVWGCIVQANTLLFKTGRGDHPAAVLYSPDPFFDEDVDLLLRIAYGIYSLKGTLPLDETLARFAHMITNEMERQLRLPLPLGMTEGREVFYTTIMVPRKHLPDRKLSQGVFPLLISPEQTPAAMILPSTFWPEPLTRLWVSNSRP